MLIEINKKTGEYIETQGKCKQSQRKAREYKRWSHYISGELDAVNITIWDYSGTPEPLIGVGRFGSEIFRIIWTLQLDKGSSRNIENKDQIVNLKNVFADRILKCMSALQTIK